MQLYVALLVNYVLENLLLLCKLICHCGRMKMFYK